MKLLTLNFLTCAIKACKSSAASFPLHPKACTLAHTEIAFQPSFVRNILPRIDWDAMHTLAEELSLTAMLPAKEDVEAIVERAQTQETVDVSIEEGKEEEVLKRLHTLLLETSIQEGHLVCGNCGFEYPVKEGVGNFLLPSHLV